MACVFASHQTAGESGLLMKPTMTPAVGIESIQIMQMLLDTCANVAEAKEK